MEQSKFYQIKNITEHEYTLVGCDGSVITRSIQDVDKSASAFTIQDAKDGDVFFQDLMGGKTFIYNGVNPDMAILYSFIISNDGEDVLPYHIGKPNTGIGNIEENKNIIHPATKKQRDTLEKAMADAGYTFDFEKKELKKIEQKPVPKFKVGDIMRTLPEVADGMTDGMPVVVSIDDKYYHCNNELIAIKDQDDYEYPPMNRRQKPTWSEEDEQYKRNIASILNKDKTIPTDMYFRLCDWLKSLKERVLPQPKQDWSEEDEEKQKAIIGILDYQANISEDRICATNGYIVDDLIDWLKSLRPQNWTKEDKERYISCLQRLSTGNPKQPETINSKWFKEHVYPKNTWKPSDEQIKAFEHFVRFWGESGTASPYDNNTKLIYSLLQDLKKLKE